MKVENRLSAAALASLLLMALLSAVPYYCNNQAGASLASLRATVQVERDFQALLSALVDAETGQRGYLITGDEEFLDIYFVAKAQLPDVQRRLAAAMPPEQQPAWGRIEELARRKVAELEKTVRLRRAAGLEAAEAIVAEGQGKRDMDELRLLLGQAVQVQAARRTELGNDLAQWSAAAARAAGVTVAAFAALAALVLFWTRRSLQHRDLARQQALQAASAAAHANEQAELRNARLEHAAALIQAMDMAHTSDEACAIAAEFLGRRKPFLTGALYLYQPSGDLERAAGWGTPPRPPMARFTPDLCWGLRQGAVHFFDHAPGLCCGHHGETGPTLCIPLAAQSVVLGCLTISGADLSAPGNESMRTWLGQLGSQIALSLHNVELRSSLKLQSLVDPLTELYNRRFLDETLRRELARAQRDQGALSVVMIDLDHFKAVNDQHGHETGDAALRAVAALLRQAIREGDVACRYGGEELAVIMPTCPAEAATARANELRLAIAGLAIPSPRGPISVTASFGVAAWPQHADSLASLLASADAALYAAKRGGRNRVLSAHQAPPLGAPQGPYPAQAAPEPSLLRLVDRRQA